jgi:hypothetical protein
MVNYSNSSLQTHPQNPYFEQWHSVSKVTGISSTQDLYRSREIEREHFEDQISMSIGANVVGRNHYGSQDAMHTLIPSSGKLSCQNLPFCILLVLNRRLKLQNHMFCHFHVHGVPKSLYHFCKQFSKHKRKE